MGAGFTTGRALVWGSTSCSAFPATLIRCAIWQECIQFISVGITGCWRSGFPTRSITRWPNRPFTCWQYWTVGVIHDGFEIDSSRGEIGSPGGLTSRLPHHRTWGSASGGSCQSLRIKQHSFSAPLALSRLGRSASSPTAVQPRSLPPAKFSPSRIVSPSSVCTGSRLPALWPPLTPVLPQRPSRIAVPGACSRLGVGVAAVPESTGLPE